MNVEKANGKTKDGVQGEGNYDAAREYDKGATEHARNPQEVSKEAKAARDALDGKEGAALERAEAEGRSHATENPNAHAAFCRTLPKGVA